MGMHEAFMADIRANPDDAPRLVYADWLDDHGDPDRAAFIRAQCRLASMGRYEPERYDLEGEAERLLAANAKKWLKPLAKITTRVEWARGFPDRISLPADKFVKQGEEAFAAAPALREYRVLQAKDGWEKMLKCKTLARVRSLDAGSHRLGLARVQALAKSPHVAGLTRLDLAFAEMRGGYRDLAASPHLAGLREIDLRGNDLGDAGLEAILGGRFAGTLTTLGLEDTGLTAAALARLARWEGAARLESLEVSELEGGDEEARAFASGEWPALRSVSLTLRRMTAAGLTALGRCASLSGLRTLMVLGGEGQAIAGLVSSPHLAGLERLDLRGSVTGAGTLADAPLLAGLRSLLVGGEDSEGLRAVLATPACAGLRELTITSGPKAIARALAAAALPGLRRLSLHDCVLTGPPLKALLSAPFLAGLVELDLSWNDLKPSDLKALGACPRLRGLRRLCVGNFMFDEAQKEAVRALQAAFPAGVVTER